MRNKVASTMRESRMSGFSLLELVIAISIFSIGLLAVAGMILTVIDGNRMSKNLTVAVNLAQNKMDSLRSASYADIADETESNLDENEVSGSGIFNRATSIEATSTDPTYKTVAVTVSWTDLSARQVVVKSIIAE